MHPEKFEKYKRNIYTLLCQYTVYNDIKYYMVSHAYYNILASVKYQICSVQSSKFYTFKILQVQNSDFLLAEVPIC